MSGRAFLVEWDEHAARTRAAALRASGWDVEWEAEDGWRAYSLIRRQVPDVVVIDLARKPAHGRELGRSLHSTSSLRDLPVVFVDGDDRHRELARKAVDGAHFTSSERLSETLANLITGRRSDERIALPA